MRIETWKSTIMFGIRDPGNDIVRHLSAWYDEDGLRPLQPEPCMLHAVEPPRT